jgi:hypothetical protein
LAADGFFACDFGCGFDLGLAVEAGFNFLLCAF